MIFTINWMDFFELYINLKNCEEGEGVEGEEIWCTFKFALFKICWSLWCVMTIFAFSSADFSDFLLFLINNVGGQFIIESTVKIWKFKFFPWWTNNYLKYAEDLMLNDHLSPFKCIFFLDFLLFGKIKSNGKIESTPFLGTFIHIKTHVLNDYVNWILLLSIVNAENCSFWTFYKNSWFWAAIVKDLYKFTNNLFSLNFFDSLYDLLSFPNFC